MMDQRDAMTIQGLTPYYVHQGTANFVMNMLSSPVHFQSNTGGNMMRSSLPLDTSSLPPHGLSVGPPPAISVGTPPAMMQGEPVRRKRGRPRKYGRDSAVSLALSSPSTSSPVPYVRPSQRRRGRPPGTGRKPQQVSLGGSFFSGPGKLVPHIINVAVGEVNAFPTSLKINIISVSCKWI